MIEERTSENNEELLSPEFMRKIERLSVLSKKTFAGQMKGERRSAKRGSSVEFADFRNYSIGDDYRRVDWNAYARLEKLFVKLFMEEEDLNIYLLIDLSESMNFGDPKKSLYAKRIVAALSYISLSNLDRVGICGLSSGKASILSPKRGKQSIGAIFEWLNSLGASGTTDLYNSIREFSIATSRPGVAIVISDFFDESYQKGISCLLSRGFDTILVHLLDKEEVGPTLVGDLSLIDSETNEKRDISISCSILKKYKEALAKFFGEIEGYCLKYGCSYVRVINSSPFEEIIQNYLRQRSVIK